MCPFWPLLGQLMPLKNQILTGSDLPFLNATFSQVSRLPIGTECAAPIEDTSAMAATSKPSIPTKGKGRVAVPPRQVSGHTISTKEDRYCVFCRKEGHTDDKCWKKHGKPD